MKYFPDFISQKIAKIQYTIWLLLDKSANLFQTCLNNPTSNLMSDLKRLQSVYCGFYFSCNRSTWISHWPVYPHAMQCRLYMEGFGCCWLCSAKMHFLNATKTKQQPSVFGMLIDVECLLSLYFFHALQYMQVLFPWENNTFKTICESSIDSHTKEMNWYLWKSRNCCKWDCLGSSWPQCWHYIQPAEVSVSKTH